MYGHIENDDFFVDKEGFRKHFPARGILCHSFIFANDCAVYIQGQHLKNNN